MKVYLVLGDDPYLGCPALPVGYPTFLVSFAAKTMRREADYLLSLHQCHKEST